MHMTASDDLTTTRAGKLRRHLLGAACVVALVGGMGAAAGPASADPTQDSAVSWAAGEAAAADTSYDGLCLQFVETAYSQAGSDVSVDASDNSSAYSYWTSFVGTKYTDTNPPAGALVFWGPTDGNPYGHVAISEGNGHAYSTEERSYVGVHDLTIAYRNEQGYPYLGYVIVG